MSCYAMLPCIFQRFSLQFVVIRDVSACLIAKQGNENRKQEVKMIISQIYKQFNKQKCKREEDF